MALILYERFFYTFSDVLAYVQDFLADQDRVFVYEAMVKQLKTIFELGSAFAIGLVKAIKKNKSGVLAS